MQVGGVDKNYDFLFILNIVEPAGRRTIFKNVSFQGKLKDHRRKRDSKMNNFVLFSYSFDVVERKLFTKIDN